MAAKYILAALGALFLIAATIGTATGRPPAQTRAWLLVGGIFAAVSIWLFSRG